MALRALHSNPCRSPVTKTHCYLSSDCYLLTVLPQVWWLCSRGRVLRGKGWELKGEDREKWGLRVEGWWERGVRVGSWKVRSERGEDWELKGEGWEGWVLRVERRGERRVRIESLKVRGERGEGWEVRDSYQSAIVARDEFRRSCTNTTL